jgi:glycosyltransferase involved in cell wall biosynthesis
MVSVAKTLVVMPAYNEEIAVTEVIAKVKKYLPKSTVLVVDDGSQDSTALRAHKAGAEVLSLPFNLGVGGAMRLGFKYALINGYTEVVQIDSDGQHDPEQVPLLVEQLKNYDLVVGSRFSGKGYYQVGGPRKWAMKFLSFVVSKSTHTQLNDTTSGFKANGIKAITIFAEQYPAEYLGDTVEALIIASRSGCKITQVPVTMHERQGGTPSQTSLKAAIYLGRAIVALFFALLRPHSKERS